MSHTAPRSDLGTHEVHNQPGARGDFDLWQSDPVIRLNAAGAANHDTHLGDYARMLGQAKMREAARDANRHTPELALFDRGGRRLDEVRYHPAYHQFMEISVAAGYSAVAWEGSPGGHATHAAMVYLASQVEPGHCCPLTMTYASAPVIAAAEGLSAEWQSKILSRRYDPSVAEIAEKHGATIGMAMTEKQGGSDVRDNTTRRWLEGERNGIRIQRLKDKLGNRSNASAEIEYDRALAYQIGEQGRGVRTIVEMVHHTRLDTAIAPAGLMRAALVEAHHWVSHRTAFQKNLVDQPLMRTVLADLTLDWEGSVALGMRVAHAFDGATREDRAFARIGVALAKFMSNKLCPVVVSEAMEVLGGMGFIEDTPLPMLYREAPLNGIWEGSGNVICLDALRTLAKEPRAVDALNAELDAPAGQDTGYDAALRAYRARWTSLPSEAEARWFVEQTALLLTAAVLIRQAPEPIADAFVATRLSGDRGRVSGTVRNLDTRAILARLGRPD